MSSWYVQHKKAWQYYKKNVEILKSSHFVGGSVESYFYVKKSIKGTVNVNLYLDDNLMVGDIATDDDVIEALKKGAGVKNCGRAARLLILQNQIFQ